MVLSWFEYKYTDNNQLIESSKIIDIGDLNFGKIATVGLNTMMGKFMMNWYNCLINQWLIYKKVYGQIQVANNDKQLYYQPILGVLQKTE